MSLSENKMFENKNYKLLQGDCLKLMQNIPNKSIDCIIADPPYGITSCKWDSTIPLEPMWQELNRIIKPNGAILMFGTEPFSSTLRMANINNYKYDIIWEKQQATNPFFAKKGIMRIHENISVFYKKQCTYNPQKTYGHKNYSGFSDKTKRIGEIYSATTFSIHNEVTDGSRYPTSIIKFNTERNGYHPTQKPISLLKYLIKTFSNENDIILDFVMGSGSTGVAAIKTNRKFIGIELEQNYFDIAKERIENIKKEESNI